MGVIGLPYYRYGCSYIYSQMDAGGGLSLKECSKKGKFLHIPSLRMNNDGITPDTDIVF